MRVRRTAPFILVALAVIAVWTTVSWRQARPYPALFAWLLDNPLSAPARNANDAGSTRAATGPTRARNRGGDFPATRRRDVNANEYE